MANGRSTTSIANTIGVGSNDVGTLCTSSKINMWSRYKPVPFLNKIRFEDTIITVNSHDSWADTPITTGSGAQNLPWYRGSSTNPIYSVPTITSYLEMFSSGVANPSSKWVYNRPNLSLNQPARMGDFIGYNHTAVCPLQAYTNYTPFKDDNNNVTLGKTHIDQYIYAGFNNLDNALNATLAKENGELSFTDIVGFMTNVSPAPLYLCIVINNVTQSIIRTYSKPTNILTTEGQSFKLKINNPSSIASGGVSHIVALNDVLEIGVYLSQTPDVEGIGKQLDLGFSLNTGDTAQYVCRTVTVGTPSIPIITRYRIVYSITNFAYSAEGYLDELDPSFGGVLPVWVNISESFTDSSNTAYQIQKGISNLSSYITIQKLQIFNRENGLWEDTVQDDNMVFNLKSLVSVSANSYDTMFGYITLSSAQYTGTNLNTPFQISGSKDGDGACNYYTNQNDAENKILGVPVACIPLPLPRTGQEFTQIDFQLGLQLELLSIAGGIENKTLEAALQSGTNLLTVSN